MFMERCFMIFEFKDYRVYLKHYIKALPKRGFGESTKMAKHLSVSSTFMSHVLAGSRTLTTEQANSLSEYLGLSDLEADYFFYLVQLEKAGTQKLKKYCAKKLSEIKSQSLKVSDRVEYKRELNDEEKSIFYSHPWYSAIHSYSATKTEGVTVEEFLNRFNIERTKLLEILNFLKETNICNFANGRYKVGVQSTHIGTDSPHLLKHHTNWRLRAIQAAESLTPEELMYTVNVSLSRNDFELLREQMVQFIDQFLKTIYPSPSEEIACFNMDWFWIRK